MSDIRLPPELTPEERAEQLLALGHAYADYSRRGATVSSGSLFGIPAGGFAKWDPQKMSTEPLTLKRLHDGIRPWADPQAAMRAGAAAVGDEG